MTYHAIGLMSGSSLDGLDVALCRLETAHSDGEFGISDWEILAAETFPFSDFWKKRLRDLPSSSAFELADAHATFGGYMGSFVKPFMEKHGLISHPPPPLKGGQLPTELLATYPKDKNPLPVAQSERAKQSLKSFLSGHSIDLIASHGHTIFHEPAQGFTTQIGDGAALAAATGCTVVADFRTADVALGGQGAPLAPIADKLLFPSHDFYLNLGGIANLSGDAGNHFVAFDVTGANQILNAVTQRFFQKNYDENGGLARSGKLEISLLEKMEALPFFDLPYPKSLSNQWVQKNLVELALETKAPPSDLLHTTCVHVGRQLAKSISQIIEKEGIKKEKYRLLPSGGGVFNSFLMACIQLENPNVEIVSPDKKVADFKEAALMALMGVMRLEGVPNCMASVTGADRDAMGGVVFLP